MAESTSSNPYTKLLGLPPEILEPNHYQILGLEGTNVDSQQVMSAATEQNGKLFRWQNNDEIHQTVKRINNEVAVAMTVLRDPEKKREYDQKLEEENIAASRAQVAESPGNHYELLGIPKFTDDVVAIRNAATERNRQLYRELEQSDDRQDVEQQIQEVGIAVRVLTNQAQKQAYDHSLGRPVPAIAIAPAKPTRVAPSFDAKNITAGVWSGVVFLLSVLGKVVAAIFSPIRRRITAFFAELGQYRTKEIVVTSLLLIFVVALVTIILLGTLQSAELTEMLIFAVSAGVIVWFIAQFLMDYL